MDLSSGALPMGMVFFGIMVAGVVRRKAGHVTARSQYPRLGAKLGLTYTPSSYKSGVGRLDGVMDGFRITVDPDDQRRIYVRFNHAPAVELHSYVHNKRPAPGTRSVRLMSPRLNNLFKTTHADDAVAARLNSADLDEPLKPLKFLRTLKTLSVTSSGITAVFDYGNPAYIPAEVIDDVLPRLLAVARVVEGTPAQDHRVAAAPAGQDTSAVEAESAPPSGPRSPEA
ncbi:MAG TPA: hypothetical protein VN764_02570 [Polyangiaceae bacterium]|nr:hypothetical protein [Polyangiaceae bacterium]